jgi:hypothetical protein
LRPAATLLLAVLAVSCGGESARESGGPYDTARDLCSIDSVDRLADEYGGHASDPASVARAYADEEFDGDSREPARAGCLAGFDSRG